MMTGISNVESLNKKLNYYVRTGKLLNPRKGIYAKEGFSLEELACSIYTPSYLSLEYVLQKEGVIFQYDSTLTLVSYLSREITIEGQRFHYRKIKDPVPYLNAGIVRQENINIATPERAFLDLIYLNQEYYVDYPDSLDPAKIYSLLPIYKSLSLKERILKLWPENGHQ